MVIQRAIRLYSGETQRSSSNISRRNRLLCGCDVPQAGPFVGVDQFDVGRQKSWTTKDTKELICSSFLRVTSCPSWLWSWTRIPWAESLTRLT